jgi:hypothetical protein
MDPKERPPKTAAEKAVFAVNEAKPGLNWKLECRAKNRRLAVQHGTATTGCEPAMISPRERSEILEQPYLDRSA